MKVATAPRLCTMLSLAMFVLVPSGAVAEDTLATAQALFDEAVTLMEKGAYERACPRLDEVVRLQPAKIGARMQVALCYEKWGKLASAWGRYRSAANVAAAAFDPREDEARAKMDELGKILPRLTVVVAAANGEIKGFSVERDGRALKLMEWDTALPLDPGTYVLQASAPGKKSWTGSVTVAGGDVSAKIEIPLLVDEMAQPAPKKEPVAPLPPPRKAASSTAIPTPLTQRRDTRGNNAAGGGALAWPWIVGGIGVVALGGAAVFGLDGSLAQNELERLCPGGQPLNTCAGAWPEKLNQLNERKNIGLGVFIGLGTVGFAFVLTGIVGLARSGKPTTTNTRVVLVPLSGPGLGGVVMRGIF